MNNTSTPGSGASVTTAAPPVTAPVSSTTEANPAPNPAPPPVATSEATTAAHPETGASGTTPGSGTDCDCKNGWLDKIVLSINNLLLSNSIIAFNKTKSQYILYFFIFLSIGFLIWISYDALKEGFFGSNDPVDTKEENSKKVKIDEVERQLQDRITNINTNLTSLKNRMDNADIVKDNKPTNLAIAIQNNILAVKEAMMKIIAGLVIQTKMNNGALNVVSKTNAFQKNMTDSINNLINPK